MSRPGASCKLKRRCPQPILSRNLASVIIAATLVLFVAFLYMFNRTIFFGEHSINRTVTKQQSMP